MQIKSSAGDRPTVLLVDDNEMVLARAKGALLAGYVIVGTATSGQAGLDAAAALNPAIIVLDISMPPGMNGFEVARRLRKAGSTARLVFLTVHEEEEFLHAAKEVGALGYVLKARLATDLEVAVREAHAGRPFQSPQDS